MAADTKIEWTDATWNPVTGCSAQSPGCKNCYAMKLAGTRLRHHPSRAGLTQESAAGPVWTGETRFNAEWLEQPLQWTRARMIFVCAHGDLFHPSVPDGWIDQVFAVMALAGRHTFQVLTKQAQRAAEYFAHPVREALIGQQVGQINLRRTGNPVAAWSGLPLPNVWIGASAEDQLRLDERLPHLLGIPAAVRYLSLEPLLGPVDLAAHVAPPELPFLQSGTPLCNDLPCNVGCARKGRPHYPGEYGCRWSKIDNGGSLPTLDWVIVGGESGHGARPMHPDWARSLRDQCQVAGVAFFFKQWGEWTPGENVTQTNGTVDAAWWVDGHWMPGRENLTLDDGHIDDQPDLYRVGKKAAGRLLDGRTWDQFPEEARNA